MNASQDQDHIHATIEQNPKVPNRNLAICDGIEKKECGLFLEKAALNLAKVGCDYVVCICNTAHYFEPSIRKGLGGDIPFVSMIDLTVKKVKKHVDSAQDTPVVGILGGKGCMVSGIYQGALERRSMQYFVLPEARQDDVMSAIYCVKQGNAADAKVIFQAILECMAENNVSTVILGCTEFPIILEQGVKVPDGMVFFDSSDILADAVVSLSKGLVSLNDVIGE